MKKGNVNSESTNNLSSFTNINTQLLKEVENICLSEIIDEKDNQNAELKKLDAELIALKADLKTFKIKAQLRESELRAHIASMADKLQIRDASKVRSNITSLQDQILSNINTIQEKAREEILYRKNEINTRTQIRLMDCNENHNEVLLDKLDEHEYIIKMINEHNYEMDKVSTNYNHVKRRVDNFQKENNGYKLMIEELNLKNNKLKLELAEVKRLKTFYLNKLEMEKYKQMQEKSNNDEIKEVVEDTLKNETNENIVNEQKKPNLSKLNINKVIQLVSNEHFQKTNPRSAATLSSLLNIYENSKNKLNKLKREIDRNQPNSELTSRVIEMLNKSKLGLVTTSDIRGMVERSKSHALVIKNNFYMNKDQRRQFTHFLLNDQNIIDIIENQKLPNIAAIDRILNKPK
jgi:hypothetical protein